MHIFFSRDLFCTKTDKLLISANSENSGLLLFENIEGSSLSPNVVNNYKYSLNVDLLYSNIYPLSLVFTNFLLHCAK